MQLQVANGQGGGGADGAQGIHPAAMPPLQCTDCRRAAGFAGFTTKI